MAKFKPVLYLELETEHLHLSQWEYKGIKINPNKIRWSYN